MYVKMLLLERVLCPVGLFSPLRSILNKFILFYSIPPRLLAHYDVIALNLKFGNTAASQSGHPPRQS
jgi:hypothetical protein